SGNETSNRKPSITASSEAAQKSKTRASRSKPKLFIPPPPEPPSSKKDQQPTRKASDYFQPGKLKRTSSRSKKSAQPVPAKKTKPAANHWRVSRKK
ncbi:MAG: hypothetical protein CMJ78_03680, partial [Planctomycetaceae bacterium]|nr:hypothetical protein [Planctomycetaceae bacterium]